MRASTIQKCSWLYFKVSFSETTRLQVIPRIFCTNHAVSWADWRETPFCWRNPVWDFPSSYPFLLTVCFPFVKAWKSFRYIPHLSQEFSVIVKRSYQTSIDSPEWLFWISLHLMYIIFSFIVPEQSFFHLRVSSCSRIFFIVPHSVLLSTHFFASSMPATCRSISSSWTFISQCYCLKFTDLSFFATFLLLSVASTQVFSCSTSLYLCLLIFMSRKYSSYLHISLWPRLSYDPYQSACSLIRFGTH